jgi:hypothetical protein
MSVSEPGHEVERPQCDRCRRPVPATMCVCAGCLRLLEQEHRPAFDRDVARLELHLRFEAEYPVEGGTA